VKLTAGKPDRTGPRSVDIRGRLRDIRVLMSVSASCGVQHYYKRTRLYEPSMITSRRLRYGGINITSCTQKMPLTSSKRLSPGGVENMSLF
jgi:uncharacterized metal-binding protein